MVNAKMGLKRGAFAILLTTILGLVGCTSSSSYVEEVEGSLELQQVQSEESGSFTSIGTVIVEGPGSAIFDIPDGVTVGRVGEGEYQVYGVTDGWFQLELVEEEVSTFVWVPPNSAKYKTK